MTGFEGHIYRVQQLTPDGLRRWRCTKKGCKGKMTTVGATEEPHVTQEHDHPPNPESIVVRICDHLNYENEF